MEEPIAFLRAWVRGDAWFEIKTSGSTGVPKTIRHAREHMVASARMTLEAIQLPPGDFLLALPSNAIGGRMVMVRAMEAQRGLWLAQPSGRPLEDAPANLAMTSLVPHQLLSSLNHLHKVAVVLLGGAPLLKPVAFPVDIKTRVYQTFGMTETVSHVALRLIHPKVEAIYTPLPGVDLQVHDDRLVIHAPALGVHHLQTNDMVAWKGTGFEWLGRADFVINSGGKKVHPEELEARLQSQISTPFYITSMEHPTFGERVVLVMEGQGAFNAAWWKDWESWKKPVKVLYINQLPQTSAGKLKRLTASGLDDLLGEEDLSIGG